MFGEYVIVVIHLIGAVENTGNYWRLDFKLHVYYLTACFSKAYFQRYLHIIATQILHLSFFSFTTKDCTVFVTGTKLKTLQKALLLLFKFGC